MAEELHARDGLSPANAACTPSSFVRNVYIYIYIYIHIYMYIYICIRPAIFLFFFILQCFFIINFFSLNPKMLRLICDDSNLECFFKESVAYEMTFPIR
jgi:hypothetical protein